MDDLTGAIQALEVNTALLTPSVARLLTPSLVPNIHRLVLAGEAVTFPDIERWNSHADLINAYGPAEASVLSHTQVVLANESESDAGSIGRAFGCVGWVADPSDHNRLSPIGAVGELLIEGPILGRGYLNNAALTAAAFIESPPWLTRGCGGHDGRQGRLYKTGDLVCYDKDGGLRFVGRKDTQAKIRGQRVELEEVEFHVRACLAEIEQLAAEVIVPAGQDSSPALAVFFGAAPGTLGLPPGQTEVQASGDAADGVRVQVVAVPSQVEDELADRLPGYMLPTVYFALADGLPLTTSGKTDRKRLRAIGGGYTAQRLAELRSERHGVKRQPSSDLERQLRALWARVLSVDAALIGLDDNFFRLGGDSITAMKLASEARALGTALSVADLFSNPKLIDLARRCVAVNNAVEEHVPPFSLLGEGENVSACCEEVAKRLGISPELIEDIYPCTPLQEGLLALTARRPGQYTLRRVLDLAQEVDLTAFREAWETVVRATPILRTRILQHPRLGLVQIVTKEGIRWADRDDATDTESYLRKDASAVTELGHPLVRFAIVSPPSTGRRSFIWTLHHAAYDGWSLPKILDMVWRAYRGDGLGQRPGFKHFVKHLTMRSTSDAEAFWDTVFRELEPTPFPVPPTSVQEVRADSVVEHRHTLLLPAGSAFTLSNLVRAGWALVAHWNSNAVDVVFGATVWGRNAPVAGIEEIIGPTVATVPIAVHVDRAQTVAAYLGGVQDSATNMMPYEQTGLRRIAQVSDRARQGCAFQTLLVVQPPEGEGSAADTNFGAWWSASAAEAFSSHALTVTCSLGQNDEFRLLANFDSRTIRQDQVRSMLEGLGTVMRRLADAAPDQLVGDIEALSPRDLEQIWAWNGVVPAAVERCIHDLFEDRARDRADAPAVCAWDGQLTYGELSDLSSRLACLLVELGVGPETSVPLCFEKSMWTTVAMLGVLKAGGAFVPLDPSHPPARLRHICQSVKARLVLANTAGHAVAAALGPQVVCVDRRVPTSSRPSPVELLSQPNRPEPGNSAYVIFTSGSTGEPKGVTI
ncbi:peptide synthetase (AMP-binding enzyme), partial [Colletotrichum chrysophilum]